MLHTQTTSTIHVWRYTNFTHTKQIQQQSRHRFTDYTCTGSVHRIADDIE